MYVELVDSVRESGGDVKMFSSLHPSGERKLFVSVIFLVCNSALIFKHLFCEKKLKKFIIVECIMSLCTI